MQTFTQAIPRLSARVLLIGRRVWFRLHGSPARVPFSSRVNAVYGLPSHNSPFWDHISYIHVVNLIVFYLDKNKLQWFTQKINKTTGGFHPASLTVRCSSGTPKPSVQHRVLPLVMALLEPLFLPVVEAPPAMTWHQKTASPGFVNP